MHLPYYKSLDGLRGIAALMVVVFHFYSYPGGFYSEPSVYKKITELGQHGVSMFFVLSGFVITRILIRAREESQYFSAFFLRRILRIAPLYYLFLVVWFYILPIILGLPMHAFADQLPYYFYLQNIYSTFHMPLTGPPHFWSLAVEEHFYLLWPVVVYYIPVKHLHKVIFSGILLALVVKYQMISAGLPIHDFTLTRMDQILMGSFLSLLELKGLFRPGSVKKFVWLAIGVVPIAFCIFVFADQYHFLKELCKYVLLGVIFAALIGAVLSAGENSLTGRFLTSPLLQYFGKISYGIYVWHVVPLILLQFFFLTKFMILDLALSLIMTIVFAHISYYYFELYFIQLKDSLQMKLRFAKLTLRWTDFYNGTKKYLNLW